MEFVKSFRKQIFNTEDDNSFGELALKLFRFQAEHNQVYRSYLEQLHIDILQINHIEQIPFLPIEFFKTQEVTLTPNFSSKRRGERVFQSSGTTSENRSRHYVSDISLYEESFRNGFGYFYGDIKNHCVLALLPSYRKDSSLIYMVNDLIKRSEKKHSGFYLDNTDELITTLKLLNGLGQKTLLFGVSFALLNLAEKCSLKLQNAIVMETGGMKGQRKEIVREELHRILCGKLGVDTIHSEYGMTELLSQAYSKGKGIFRCPPWMRILIRDVNDPFTILKENQTGGINIIDLANIYSCSFIATQDLGKRHADGSFEVLGRFDNSDLRGCNLMIE